MESGTLEGLLKANGLPVECLAELLKPPYNISTIKQFANFFDDKAEVNSEFCSKTALFKDRGDLVANAKQAWREAEAMVQRSLKRTVENVNNESLEEPLKYDDAEKLEKAYTAAYGIHVPPTWMGFSTMLGRFHREFTRRAHTVFHINKVRNMEQVVLHGPQQKHQRVGGIDFTYGDSEKMAELNVTNIFTYLMGLKAVLYTMGMAGAYKIERDGKQVFFAPMDPLLRHLAQAEAYVLRHSHPRDATDKCSDAEILKQLVHVDEGIRAEWARLVRANEPEGVTLGEAQTMTASFAAALFLTPPSKSTQSHQQSSNQGGQQNYSSPHKSPVLSVKNAGKGREKGAKNGKFSAVQSFGAAHKTCKFTEDNKKICKFYNDPRSCTNRNCADAHVCDIMLATGKACGLKNHNRVSHKGMRIPL